MKSNLYTCVLVFFVAQAFSQSKVTTASRSELSGIELPGGSKQDMRILVTAAAKMALQLVADDNDFVLADAIEVFSLPLVNGAKEAEDKVKQSAQLTNWNIAPLPNQTKYWLLTKSEKSILVYVGATNKDVQFYLSSILSVQQNLIVAANQPDSGYTNTAPTITEQPVNPVVNTPEIKQPTNTDQNLSLSGSYTFTTINFDDGWVSTVREDWVEVTKGKVKALIHYPNAITNKYISNPDEERQIAWNTLVAPRYSNLQNYFVAKSALSYIEGSFVSGTVTDNETGQTVYVALFHRGSSPWIEFVAPNINAFGQVTGFDVTKLNDYVKNEDWDVLQKLEGYNKFAVAASDLTGTWTNNFSGFQHYVNAYSDADAGMNTHSSTQTFEFNASGNYNWSIGVASGFVGNIKFSNAKSSGKFTNPNNWQIHFSDLEGKPRLYNAYFSCIKGARILWLQDTGYGDYSSYGKREP